jgi:DNA-directed RNA polymerase subunit M/transcription elongation factor TFIIS
MTANIGRQGIKYAIDSNTSFITDEKMSLLWTKLIHVACIRRLQETHGDDIYWEDKEFFGDYAEMCQRVAYGLMAGPTLEKVVDGTIALRDLTVMTMDEMNPRANDSVKEDINIRQNVKIDLKTTKYYKCERCGSKETVASEKQTRGADEESTLIVTCANAECKHQWRVGR